MRRVKTALACWATGRSGGLGAVQQPSVLVSEDAALARQAASNHLVDDRWLVLVGGGAPSPDQVTYSGGLAAPGEEFILGDSLVLQTQSYGMSHFMSAAGPTLVRVADEDDLRRFFADADSARETGQFPSFLLDPMVQLADQPALGWPADGDGPSRRLYAAADGSVSTSPSGSRLGSVSDGPNEISATFAALSAGSLAGCPVALGALSLEAQRLAGCAARPWLSDYLRAISARQLLATRGFHPGAVAGFGASLLTQDAPARSWRGDEPLVFWEDEQHVVVDPVSARVFTVSQPVAAITEALSGRDDADPELIAELAGIPQGRAFDAVRRVRELLGGNGLMPAVPHTLQARG